VFNGVADITQFDLVNSRTFKDLSCFQVVSRPRIEDKKIQVLSRTFKDAWEPCHVWSATDDKPHGGVTHSD